jgi:hypothetical protein
MKLTNTIVFANFIIDPLDGVYCKKGLAARHRQGFAGMAGENAPVSGSTVFLVEKSVWERKNQVIIAC